jgi:hypothetical protein
MSNAQGKPWMIACAMALAIAVPSLEAEVRPGGAGPADRWNRFSADVTVRRTVVDAGGDPAANRTPPTTYRWERTQSAAGWKTTMEVKGSVRAAFVTPTGALQEMPPAVTRIEDDGDDGGPVFYGLNGKRLRLPAAADRQKMGVGDDVFAKADALVRPEMGERRGGARAAPQGREWIEALMPSPDKRAARAQGLKRRFGAARDAWQGRDRYVEVRGDDATEVLVDGVLAVPVEINVVRGGMLRSHATFAYGPGPGGSMLRRSAHVERALDDGKATSARMVMDVEIANVRLEERR